jgi:RND family efflux transporter MFP subunit
MVISRKSLLALGVTTLALLALAVAYRGELVGWARGERPAATEDERAGRTLPAPAEQGERKVLYWYDPMHPQYTSDRPGMAPDCGMQLVPKYADEAKAMPATATGTVHLSPAKQQLIGVRTAVVGAEDVSQSLRAVGMVEVDETRVARVHTKVSGWVRRVFVDYTWQHVQRGEPLFTLYSPELVSAQQEYLLARRAQSELGNASYRGAAEGSEALLRAARMRLKLWDVTDEQIAELEARGQPEEELTFHSPTSGHVAERKVFPNQYITPESELYSVVDHSRVWVQSQLYEYELAAVRVGQPATLTVEAHPGRLFRGRVAFVPPHLEMATRTQSVRLEFDNPELALKPGMYANVEIRLSLGRQLVIPRDAVLDTGERRLVFVARGDGFFEPREIQLGQRLGDRVVVRDGLRPGETIAASGVFLIDSESRLKSAMEGMRH